MYNLYYTYAIKVSNRAHTRIRIRRYNSYYNTRSRVRTSRLLYIIYISYSRHRPPLQSPRLAKFCRIIAPSRPRGKTVPRPVVHAYIRITRTTLHTHAHTRARPHAQRTIYLVLTVRVSCGRRWGYCLLFSSTISAKPVRAAQTFFIQDVGFWRRMYTGIRRLFETYTMCVRAGRHKRFYSGPAVAAAVLHVRAHTLSVHGFNVSVCVHSVAHTRRIGTLKPW